MIRLKMSGLGSKMAAEPGQQDGSEAMGGWTLWFLAGSPATRSCRRCSQKTSNKLPKLCPNRAKILKN